VLSEAVYKHLGNKDTATVFPGFNGTPQQFLRYM
jgi:hypothetical protein